MKIIQPTVEAVTPLNGKEILKRIETCGRVCYKSEHRITDDSYTDFCAHIIERGHESVLEHCSFSLKFTCDRGVSHEIVRHRLASYSQESTRYCNYSNERFNAEIVVIEPLYLIPNTEPYNIWKNTCQNAEYAYFALLDAGLMPQEARSVLPNSLKTELIMTANIREWRHFFKLRCSVAAHPQMRQVALMALDMVRRDIPILFDDIWAEVKK